MISASGTVLYEDLSEYDAVSNRVQQSYSDAEGALTSTTFAYDLRDRLLTDIVLDGVTASYDWDTNGRLVRRSTPAKTVSYIWDDADRLVSVEKSDGTTVHHQYDGDGVRVATRLEEGAVALSETLFLNDTSGPLSRIVAEFSADGQQEARHVWADRLLGLVRMDEKHYPHGDAVGSVRLLTQDTATATDRYTYDAHGSLIDRIGDYPSRFLFAGEAYEETSGLYDLRARWLEPQIGRFASLDPVWGSPSRPRTLNGYLYANAQPTLFTDPAGTFASVNDMMASLQANAIVSKGLLTVQRVITLLDKVDTIIDMWNLIRNWRRMILALLQGEVGTLASLVPAKLANELLDAALNPLTVLRYYWKEFQTDATHAAPNISAESFAWAATRAATWTANFNKDFKFLVFMPTAPGPRQGLGGKGSDTPKDIPRTRYRLLLGTSGGRLFGFGVQMRPSGQRDQIFRLDYSHGTQPPYKIPDCHYHIGGGGETSRRDCRQ